MFALDPSIHPLLGVFGYPVVVRIEFQKLFYFFDIRKVSFIFSAGTHILKIIKYFKTFESDKSFSCCFNPLTDALEARLFSESLPVNLYSILSILTDIVDCK